MNDNVVSKNRSRNFMKGFLNFLLLLITHDKSKAAIVSERLFTREFWRKNWFRLVVAIGLAFAFSCLVYGSIILLLRHFSSIDGFGIFLVKISFGVFFLCVSVVVLRWFLAGMRSIARWACVDSWQDYIKVIIFVSVIGVAVIMIYAFLVRWRYPNLNQRGVFGDSFGALNAFIALCGFGGLWISITLQRHQMNEEHRREMRNKWPVCTFDLNHGELSLTGLENGKRILTSIRFDMLTKNLSDMIVVNVINAIGVAHTKEAAKEITCIYGEVVPLIDAKKELSSSVEVNNRGSVTLSMDVIDALLADEESESRKVDAIAYYSNVQGCFFKVSLGFRISLQNEEAKGTLLKWADSIRAVRKRLTPELFGAWLNIEIEKEFAIRGVKWGDSVAIGFDFRAGSFSIEEITQEEYAKVREESIAAHKVILRGNRHVDKDLS